MNSGEEIKPKRYRFKDIKVYASTEWLSENKKKYRQVFDYKSTSYIYAEFSFYNKLYDQENWDAQITLHCFEVGKKPRKVCSLDLEKRVNKFDNIVYVREGWGNKKNGAFWKTGTYYWEAWLNGKKLGTKYFYVNNLGHDTEIVKLENISMFEGQYDNKEAEFRTNLCAFSAEQTRYIYADITFENLKIDESWHQELFISFYNEARELKGRVVKLTKVNPQDEILKLTAGWGSNTSGSWRKGFYTMELVFNEQLIAAVSFEIGDEFEEGEIDITMFNRNGVELVVQDESKHLTFEDVMSKMDKLVGLKSIKQKVRDHAMYLQFLQLRANKGIEEGKPEDLHSVFVGNPGTGKTTVAKMIGLLYKKMGLLTKGHVHEVDRVDLVGEYIGQTAPKVKEAIKKARGGVLFIDEAYSLVRINDDSKDFGKEVVEILVKEMSNGEGNISVIVAGYPKEMKHFIDSNPGLKSRFKHFFHFDDYLPNELSAIAEYACEEKQVKLAVGARKKIDQIILDSYRNRDRSFGNARFVYDLIENAKINLGLRVMNLPDHSELKPAALKLIKVEDANKLKIVQEKQLPFIPIDKELLSEAKAELNALIGIGSIKKQINELIAIIEYHLSSGKNVLNSYNLHTVFVGNPGTGKTTVARILTKIYKALSLLERGHIIETDRQGLIAGYVGQTALKTTEKIDEAMGGVLFIDEAYALSNYNGRQGDFGNEAIQTILKRMEDDRGKFFVFAAGYPDNMEFFLKANPGLSSRFDKLLKFDDYSASELYDIAIKMIADEKYEIEGEAKVVLKDYLIDLHLKRNKYFGNAREVRKIVNEIIRVQNLRLASALKSGEELNTNLIIAEDIGNVHLTQEKDVFTRSQIGFKG